MTEITMHIIRYGRKKKKPKDAQSIKTYKRTFPTRHFFSHIYLKKKKKSEFLIIQSYNSTHANTIALEVSHFHTHTNKGYLSFFFFVLSIYPLQSPVI